MKAVKVIPSTVCGMPAECTGDGLHVIGAQRFVLSLPKDAWYFSLMEGLGNHCI